MFIYVEQLVMAPCKSMHPRVDFANETKYLDKKKQKAESPLLNQEEEYERTGELPDPAFTNYIEFGLCWR